MAIEAAFIVVITSLREVPMKLRIAAAMLVLLFSPLLFSQASKPQPQSKKATVAKQASTGELVDRVGTTGFFQLLADSFRSLSPKQQELAYWLSQASIAIDPIIYEQLSRFGVRQKRLLEEIASHPQEVDPTALGKIEDFAKLFWANRGNHNELTSQKFTELLRTRCLV
jgi:dipeptidyl-peptidase-3